MPVSTCCMWGPRRVLTSAASSSVFQRLHGTRSASSLLSTPFAKGPLHSCMSCSCRRQATIVGLLCMWYLKCELTLRRSHCGWLQACALVTRSRALRDLTSQMYTSLASGACRAGCLKGQVRFSCSVCAVAIASMLHMLQCPVL